MKTLLPLILLILLCHHSANAQWHGKSCGVQDIKIATSDEFECMWNKASTTVKVGQVTCLVGGGISIIGGAMALLSSGSDAEAASGYAMISALVVTVGLSAVAISIPIWAVGASRKSRLMKSPAYQNLQRTSLMISPTLEKNRLNQQAIPGLAISLTF